MTGSTEFPVAKARGRCYNNPVPRRVGISVLQRLPKPLRRVRLPYPAPMKKGTLRVPFFIGNRRESKRTPVLREHSEQQDRQQTCRWHVCAVRGDSRTLRKGRVLISYAGRGIPSPPGPTPCRADPLEHSNDLICREGPHDAGITDHDLMRKSLDILPALWYTLNIVPNTHIKEGDNNAEMC